jgi:hypothetical protein
VQTEITASQLALRVQNKLLELNIAAKFGLASFMESSKLPSFGRENRPTFGIHSGAVEQAVEDLVQKIGGAFGPNEPSFHNINLARPVGRDKDQ